MKGKLLAAFAAACVLLCGCENPYANKYLDKDEVSERCQAYLPYWGVESVAFAWGTDTMYFDVWNAGLSFDGTEGRKDEGIVASALLHNDEFGELNAEVRVTGRKHLSARVWSRRFDFKYDMFLDHTDELEILMPGLIYLEDEKLLDYGYAALVNGRGITEIVYNRKIWKAIDVN